MLRASARLVRSVCGQCTGTHRTCFPGNGVQQWSLRVCGELLLNLTRSGARTRGGARADRPERSGAGPGRVRGASGPPHRPPPPPPPRKASAKFAAGPASHPAAGKRAADRRRRGRSGEPSQRRASPAAGEFRGGGEGARTLPPRATEAGRRDLAAVRAPRTPGTPSRHPLLCPPPPSLPGGARDPPLVALRRETRSPTPSAKRPKWRTYQAGLEFPLPTLRPPRGQLRS